MRGPGAGGRSVVGDYELLGALGQGAMGVVHRARHLPTGGVVALKLIRGAGPELVREERFRREAEVARALDHPGIVRVLDAGEAGGVPFIAFELVQGARTLREVLPERPREQRVALVRDVARAIGTAHARGVVHRDLKPENVLVDLGGTPRVADFGLATARGLTRLTNTGIVVGTPLYMAPEQYAGDRARIGPPTDVWALGVMLHEALLDAAPFPADSNLFEMAVRVREPVSPPRALDPTVPEAISGACARALETDPARRFPDGEAMARALDEALGEGDRARRERPRRARRRAFVGPAAGAVTVVAAVAVAVVARRTTPPAFADPAPAPSTAPSTAPPPIPLPDSPILGAVVEGAGSCATMPTRQEALVRVGDDLWAAVRVSSSVGFDSVIEVRRSRDAGRTWEQVATSRGVVPTALNGGLALLAGGRLGVLVHGGDLTTRRFGAWFGAIDPTTGAWLEPLAPALDPHADEFGWLDAVVAGSAAGPVVVGTTQHRRSLFRRAGPNGWTPLQRISDEPTGFVAVLDDPGGGLHFVYSVPAVRGGSGALRYRRWDDFDWAPEGPLDLDGATTIDFTADVDAQGTVHAVWTAAGVARYARRLAGAAAFERFEVAPAAKGDEVALRLEPTPAIVLLQEGRLRLSHVSGPRPGEPEVVADLSDEGTIGGLCVLRRPPPGRRLVALVTVRRGRTAERILAVGR
ncbi:MAG: serine/threonine protein kinase [Planctomycetes bacterium]|nr:serine/threonine protein kinase [Planctomycetota bacterium]